MSIFTIYLLKAEEVSAEENLACCEKVENSDTYCAFIDENLCDTDFNKQVGTQCAGTTFCGLGCCWDPNTGEYARNTNRASCESKGWSFDGSDASCSSVPALEEGCCQLPSGCSYVTQASCRAAITDLPQLRLNDVFRNDIQDEYTCQNLCRSADVGCFVPSDLNADQCSFGFRSEFNEQDGTFREGVYCSNVPVCSSTEKHTKGCLTPQQAQYFGDDDNVHWFDSLGNPEEVVGNKYTGYVDDIKYERACNPDEDNTNNPNCGFCDSIGQSNICGEVELNAGNDYQCVSLDCGVGNEDIFKWVESNEFDTGWKYSEEGNSNFNIKNGDAWCYYEGVKGEGRDLIGSRDYLFRCKDGEIISETQGDKRSNVCYMSFDENNRPNANLIPNEAINCLDANDDKLEGSSECTQSDDYEKAICNRQKRCEDLGSACHWNSDVDRCAPNVAPSETSTCKDQGSFEFLYGCSTSIFSGRISGNWDCEPVYEKYNEYKVNEYNNFCRSVGDCGVWYNTEGVKSGNYEYTKEKYSGDNAVAGMGKLPELNVPNTQQFSYTYLDGNQSKLYQIWLNLLNDIQNLVKGYDSGENFNQFHRPYRGALWTIGGTYALLGITYTALAATTGITAGAALTAFLSSATGGLLFPSAVSGTGGFLVTTTGVGTGGIGGSFTASGLSGVIISFGTFLVVVEIAAIAAFLINLWSSKEGVVKITYQCLPWTAPANSNLCEQCDDPNNPYDVCTEYKCTSLGANCDFEDAGGNAENGVGFCASLDREENPPTISPLEVYDNKQYQPVADGGYNIREKFGYDEPIVIGIKTNERALCKISKTRDQEFDIMQWFDNENWQLEHKIELSLVSSDPGLDSLDIYGAGQKTYYASCQDIFNNERNNYRITFEMDETPDVESPRIVKFDPINEAFIPYNQEKTNVYLLVQDRSGVEQCRYSLSPDLSFENMENTLRCTNKLIRDSEGLSGYECIGQINDIQNSVDNKYYFKCRDNSESKRSNSQDTEYLLKGTIPLVISDFSPGDEEIIYSRNLVLQTTTDRGAQEGKAECRYLLSQDDIPNVIYESMFRFSETDSTNHEHNLILNTGDYNLVVKCRDAAGNQDLKESTFTVDTPDLIISELLPEDGSNVYDDNFELKVTTEEGINGNGDSTCYYTLNDVLQGFIPDKSVLESHTEHTKDLSLGDGTYNIDILCEDSAGKQAEDSTSVEVRKEAAPQLRRVYTASNSLTIEISEPSECKYSSRNFDYETEGQAMVADDNNLMHRATLQNVFYIICENINNGNRNEEPFVIYP